MVSTAFHLFFSIAIFIYYTHKPRDKCTYMHTHTHTYTYCCDAPDNNVDAPGSLGNLVPSICQLLCHKAAHITTHARTHSRTHAQFQQIFHCKLQMKACNKGEDYNKRQNTTEQMSWQTENKALRPLLTHTHMQATYPLAFQQWMQSYSEDKAALLLLTNVLVNIFLKTVFIQKKKNHFIPSCHLSKRQDV